MLGHPRALGGDPRVLRRDRSARLADCADGDRSFLAGTVPRVSFRTTRRVPCSEGGRGREDEGRMNVDLAHAEVSS